MTFGEVGETEMQATTGYASVAHGLGQVNDTRVLERMVKLPPISWTTAPITDTILYEVDIDKYLREYDRNERILSQYNYYRSDIEVTIRLVSNQFYYGSLMATLFPTNATGHRLDERAVLDPTELPAASDQAVIKTWSYSWPQAWKRLSGSDVDAYPTRLVIDQLCPLTRAKESMPDNVTVLIWARFKNITLSYPVQPRILTFDTFSRTPAEAQSGDIALIRIPQVKAPAKPRRKHPAEDPSAVTGYKSIDKAINAITSITMGDAVGGAVSLGSSVMKTIGNIAPFFMFDKPDRYVPQTPVINEPSIDLFNTDIADSNVSVGVCAGRYVDPGSGRMPMTKNWSVSQYAQIPGLRSPYHTFISSGDNFTIPLLQQHPTGDSMKIPLDYAWLSSGLWRGSLKVYFQFRTSGFNSARISVATINNVEYPGQFASDYSNGLSKVINVKGDTNDTFCIPWLSSGWWSEDALPAIKVTLETPIATQDVSLDPKIYMLTWVAGGEDIQFAFPRVPQVTEWRGIADIPPLSLKGKQKAEAQTAIGGVFTSNFPPIVDNCHADIDTGFCTFENLGSVTDLTKRYSALSSTSEFNRSGFDAKLLDITFDPANPDYDLLVNDVRSTIFGAWRAAFLFRSGGYRFRHYVDRDSTHTYSIDNKIGGRTIPGTFYRTPVDDMARLTVPQLANYPFAVLGQPIQRLSILLIEGSTEPNPLVNPRYIAARDDIQLGFPILPAGLLPLS
jgi:hypothetical protein